MPKVVIVNLCACYHMGMIRNIERTAIEGVAIKESLQ